MSLRFLTSAFVAIASVTARADVFTYTDDAGKEKQKEEEESPSGRADLICCSVSYVLSVVPCLLCVLCASVVRNALSLSPRSAQERRRE
jgi:hypothetical protein